MSSQTTAGQAAAARLAAEAYALVQSDPRPARALAERALDAARRERDPRAQVAALLALAWAEHELGDTRAGSHARTGIRIAERHGDIRGAALLHRRLAVSLAFDGKTRAARREIDVAIGLLHGRDRAQSEVFRLLIHRRSLPTDASVGREVRLGAAKALRVLHLPGDEIWRARLLYNRGLLLSDCGELAAAEADLRRAYTLYAEAGATAAMADALAAVAELKRQRGDLLSCLALLDQVRSALPTGEVSYNLEEFRALALIQARLLPEARAATEAFAALLARTGRGDELPRTMLDVAAVALASGDTGTARRYAASAARSFAARHKPVNAALARGMRLRACLAEGDVGSSSLRSALAAAAALQCAGWRRDSLRMHVLAARIALATGSLAAAQREVECARSLNRLGTVSDRVELCLARALVDIAGGNPERAGRSLARGLGLLEIYRAGLGDVELRAAASGIGAELAKRGLELAIGSSEPAKILAWAERLRANALRLPTVRPPADASLGVLQATLRRTTNRLREAEARGKPARGLAASQTRLEAAIRSRALLAAGSRSHRPTGKLDLRDVALLGDRVLVEYVEAGRRLGAVTLVDGQLSYRDLGAERSAEELEWLRFALGRVARARTRRERAEAHRDCTAVTGELDRLLVAPLSPALASRPLVIVPTGALHAIPWGILPSLRGRPIVVSPSLSTWLALARREAAPTGTVALLAGPRLRHATAEIRDLSTLHPQASVLQGRAATAHAALAALEGAAIAHLACHGRFRADSPLFSSLELADGPMNVYELQQLRRAPAIVVLSSCELGSSGVYAGNELIGLAAALLGMGTHTIVASVAPVSDTETRRLMADFHGRLLAGEAPAAALAAAQADRAATGFVCLGLGFPAA